MIVKVINAPDYAPFEGELVGILKTMDNELLLLVNGGGGLYEPIRAKYTDFSADVSELFGSL